MKPSIWTGTSILLATFTLGLGYAPEPGLAQDEQSPPALLEVEGTLEEGDSLIPMDNSLYDQYSFEGQAGQQVKITLESSDFDAYLIVLTPDRELLGQADDISEDNLNAQLTITLPNDGQYIVLANAFDQTGRGQYALTVVPQDSQDTSNRTALTDSPETDSPTHVEDYIGTTFVGDIPGQPSSLPGQPVHLGGWMIVPPNMTNPDEELRYGINNLLADDTLILLFSETIGYESDGRAIWRVLDATHLPTDNLALTDTMDGDYFPTSSCLINGTPDPEVFAIVRIEEQEFFTDIQKAWRANRETGRLEEISVDGVRCVNPGWGV